MNTKRFQQQTRGLVIVYTGEGNGKTTAALGLALRASGYGKKTLIIQFGKTWFSGEIKGVEKLKPFVRIIQGGKGFVKILGDKLPLRENRKAALETFENLYKKVLSGKWDLVIADEIIGAQAAKLLPLSAVLKLIKDKPENIDLILTGHHAHPQIVAKADLVTEMKAIKHPFTKHYLAKEGIDY